MSTTNGVGTMYYGWRHHGDGTATATMWWVLFWLPVLPLARHKLKVLTDLKKNESLRPLEAVAAVLGAAEAVQHTSYRVLEKGRVVTGEVWSTYVWTYLIGPALVAWPLALLWAGNAVLARNPLWRQSNAVLYVGLAAGVLLMVNPIAVVLIALRRARGFNGGLFE